MIIITGVTPAEGSRNNLASTLVEFSLLDESNIGMDLSTLIVDISGARAIEGGDFVAEYSGEYSEINIEDDLIEVIINPEVAFIENSVIGLRIQIQDINDKYYNFNYSFKIVSNKPYIFSSSPENDDIVLVPQKIYLDIRDDVNNLNQETLKMTINGANIYNSGEFISPFVGNESSLVSSDGKLEVTIDPEEFIRDGDYNLRIQLEDVAGNKINQVIQFSVRYTGIVLPAVFPQGGFVGFSQGITRVVDDGNGSDIDIFWSVPISRYYGSDIHTLLYYSKNRLDIFDSMPKYIVTASILTATLDGFDLGTGYYFAARAMESYKDSIDINGMSEKSTGVYVVPDETTLVEILNIDDYTISVTSTSGYPESGFLLIDDEVIKYNAINGAENKFVIPSDGRGLNNSDPAYHDVGSSVKMFLLCQDDNNVIIYGSASFQEPTLQTGRQNNSIGFIVPNFSDFERMEHDGLDHCGYHSPLPWQTLNNKNDCGSYLGGIYNGFRGMDIFQRAMDREEELMESVGEKCVLLKRIWSGETCSCVTSKRQHPKIRSCKFCYGTGYIGGYEQVLNLRRADQMVMIRFYEATEDLKLGDHSHLSQEFQPTALALFKPIIKDRDIIVRFDFTGDIEYIYEVLNVNRERFVFNKYGRQKLSIIRLDKTDILYQVPFEL